MLHKDKALLVVVDVQGRLLPAIHEADKVVVQISRLIRGFRILGAPILITEQYRKGLGETDPRIQAALAERDAFSGEPGRFEPIEKMSFSCVMDPTFIARWESSGRNQVVLCGIEAHVCVLQTALQMVERGAHVEIAADAVSSRSPQNRDIALRRMESEGAKITSVESAIFEMLEYCGTDAFKSWVRVIK
jgi:nicotinamidase-related amidase